MPSGLSSFRRYVYLNTYAYLLLFMGVGIAFVPLYRVHWLLAAVQAVLVAVVLKAAFKILLRWKEKKRSYNVLVERNRNGIRDELFKEYMQAPCGRLLVKVVLNDLGERQRYKILKRKYSVSLLDTVREMRAGRKNRKTIVYIADDKQKQSA
ncbi:MAG: hypothetical protein IJY44_02165 [Bacteroidaceae bacterium]|nr:hypothetical protein [Bacteroidaceae bacterium]